MKILSFRKLVLVVCATAMLCGVANAKVGNSLFLAETQFIKGATKKTVEPIYKVGALYTPVLTYHHIAPKPGNNPYYVSPDIFDKQMAWLRDNGYEVISYDRFYQGVTGGAELPRKPVVLTFDDGDLDHYTAAFPILKKYGYSGTFFIVTNYVDRKSFMTWDMLKEMSKAGMEIESHTVNHATLAALAPDKTDYELSKSKETLEEKLGIKVKYLAYPGGSYSKTTLKGMPKAGYLSAVTVNHSVYHKPGANPFLVSRMHIDSDMESFVGFVTGRRVN